MAIRSLHLAILLCFSVLIHAQPLAWPTFENGDRVCFVGNSITAQGHFHYFINLYYATRFPDKKVTFYNCGVTGNVASQILERIDKDVLPLKPTYCVLMVGMNDVNRELYSKDYTGVDVEAKKQKAIDVYRGNTDSLVRKLSSKCKLVLLRPSIYDQTAKLPGENLYGVNDALKACCRQIDLLGKKYKVQVVDLWHFMNSVNHNVQKSNPAATIIGNDRVHPGIPGHFVMAYRFIQSTNPSRYVAKMVIDHRKKASECDNCRISGLQLKEGRIQLVSIEKSLPFPVQDDAREALGWVPFAEDLNKEIIQIKNLARGKYKLSIDNILIGNYSEIDLENGVDIAGYNTTPQYRQAQKVMQLLLERSKMQADLRKGKYAEYNYLAHAPITYRINFAAEKRYLDSQLIGYKNGPKYDYIKENFDSYLRNRPIEGEILQKMAQLNDSVYQVNKPVAHMYTVEKL